MENMTKEYIIYDCKSKSEFKALLNVYGKEDNDRLTTQPGYTELVTFPSGDVYECEFKNGYARKGKISFKSGNIFEGDMSSSGEPCNGKAIIPGSFVFEGHLENYRPHRGKLTYDDGNCYYGELVEGKYEGRGKYTSADGKYSCDGSWKNGKKHGHCRIETQFTDATNIEESDWCEDVREGRCIFYTRNGRNPSIYTEVYFKEGQLCGKFRSSDFYKIIEGDVINGVPNGTMKNAEGILLFEGEFLLDEQSIDTYDEVFRPKTGKMYTKEGVYEGNFEDFEYEGQGRMTYSDGTNYDGEWKNGEKHGHGITTYTDGSSYENIWNMGYCISGYIRGFNVSPKFPDYENHFYEGVLVDGLPEGWGREVDPEGVYEGYFHKGEREGQGKYTYNETGRGFEGEWKDDRPFTGVGKYKYFTDYGYYPGEYDGEWKDGERNGFGRMININGSTLEAEWKENFQGHGKSITDEYVFEGDFDYEDGILLVNGKWSFANGDTFIGILDPQTGGTEGKGTYLFSNGDVYEGEVYVDYYYLDNPGDDFIMPNGHGIMTYADGRVIEGNWEYGEAPEQEGKQA